MKNRCVCRTGLVPTTSKSWAKSLDMTKLRSPSGKRKRSWLRLRKTNSCQHRQGAHMTIKAFLVALLIGSCLQPFSGWSQEKVKLRVSSATKTLGYGPLWIGSKMGFFERQNLAVDLVVIRASDVGIQALA